MIRVVVAAPGAKPVISNIDPSLKSLQSIVGGLVECVHVGGLDLWVNEEGLLLDLPFNREIEGIPLVGTILVTGTDGEGELTSLSDSQIEDAFQILG